VLAILAALFLSIAHAENNAAPTVSAQAETPQRGALYRVRHQDNMTYLFGTIHVGAPEFFPLEPQVTRALNGASKLVLEIDIRDQVRFQRALQKHGLYATGDSIDRHLSPDGLAEVQLALQRYGLAFDHIRQMKPWMLTNMLLSIELARNGYHYSQGVERFLLSLSEEQAKSVQALESADYQMSLFDTMSEATQEQYLREQLAELSGGNSLKKARALIDAWAGGNSDAIESIMREGLDEKSVTSEFTQRMLLDRRNPAMADKIEALLRNDAHTFVGVGLLHLVGNGSLPALLRQRGYEVERLY
jgi:uncharacterized protein YbaP (TraB family)